MLKMAAWVKYVPALFFLLLWIQFIDDQLAVEKVLFTSSIGSPAMLQGFYCAMDNPWQRKGANQLYIKRLVTKGAPQEVWLNSEIYARALWEQAQFPGLLEALIKIAVLKNSQYDIDRLTRLYLSAYPHLPFAKVIERNLRSRQINRPD